MKVLAKTVTNEELARELMHVVTTFLQLKQDPFNAAIRVGAPVSGAAVSVFKAV